MGSSDENTLHLTPLILDLVNIVCGRGTCGGWSRREVVDMECACLKWTDIDVCMTTWMVPFFAWISVTFLQASMHTTFFL